MKLLLTGTQLIAVRQAKDCTGTDRRFFLAAAVAPPFEINIKRIETGIKRSEE